MAFEPLRIPFLIRKKRIALNELTIEIIESLEAWKRLAGACNDLLNRSRCNTVFLTSEWLFSWAECYMREDRKLFIIAVYQDLTLIGIAPWYIRTAKYNVGTMRQIEFLGSPEAGSDYLDVIVKRGKERDVAAALYEFLFNDARSHWDCMLLTDIPAPSLFLLYFLETIEAQGKYAEIKHSSYCPFVSQPEQPAHFMSALSRNRREQFRRHWRLLKDQAGIEYRSFSGNDCSAALRNLLSLYRETSEHYSQSLDQFVNTFAARSHGKNWLQIDVLTAHDRMIAGLLHLRYQRELGMYLMVVDKAFNPKISIGNVLVGLAIEKAFEQGASRYDFLKGHESYKFHWADSGIRSLSLFLTQTRVNGLMLSTEQFIKHTAKILLR